MRPEIINVTPRTIVFEDQETKEHYKIEPSGVVITGFGIIKTSDKFPVPEKYKYQVKFFVHWMYSSTKEDEENLVRLRMIYPDAILVGTDKAARCYPGIIVTTCSINKARTVMKDSSFLAYMKESNPVRP